MSARVLTWLLDLLYPPRCMICGHVLESAQTPICKSCVFDLPEYEGAEPKVQFSSHTAVTFYYEDKLRGSILRWKFGGMRNYTEQFGKWMSVTIRDKFDGKFDLVSWVPVSKRRKRRRGYDQAELLCRQIAGEFGLQAVRLLEKTRHTKAQSSLRGQAARRANIVGAYRPVQTEQFEGKRVLLIDDILTTGATLSECCRVLRTAGAVSVVCAALATPRDQREG